MTGAAAVGVFALATLGEPAFAAPDPAIPDGWSFFGDGHTRPAGTLCPFEVIFGFTRWQKIVELPGDRLIVSTVDLTFQIGNLQSGSSVTITPSGTSSVVVQPNGDVVVTFDGKNLFGDGLGSLLLTNGHFEVTFDAEGNVIEPLHGSGKLTDVCALIA